MTLFSYENRSTTRPLVFHGDTGELVPDYEYPGRLDAVLRGAAGCNDRVTVHRLISFEEMRQVHDPLLIEFYAELEASAQTMLFPDSFPERTTRPPTDLRGRMGYFCTDTQTPFHPEYWDCARRAAACAVDAATHVRADQHAFAACRPPGHHAGPSYYGGFCYLNNAALASTELARDRRIAILDLDYHHGNGTQDCFYGTDRVLTVSIHADGRHAYPFFSGDEEETGSGAGTGYNVNLPLPLSAGRNEWFAAFARARAAVAGYGPEALVVSFGADTCASDPIGGFGLDVSDYGRIGHDIRELSVPTLVVLEGGYDIDALPGIVSALIEGFGP